MKRAMQGLMMASILMVGAISIASAALPEPQDPQVVANMSYEQRLQMSKDLREQFKWSYSADFGCNARGMHDRYQHCEANPIKSGNGLLG